MTDGPPDKPDADSVRGSFDRPADTPDPDAVRRAFDRAATTYDDAAILQGRVRDELLERLDVVRLSPSRVLDLGTGTGIGAAALKNRFRKAEVLAVDFAPRMLATAARRSRWRRRFKTVCADAAVLPFDDGSIDLVFSNLMIPWCPDPDAVLREMRRVLAPGGLMTFSTFGPDTLMELRACWDGVDMCTHVQRFIDMHDVGDALVRAGLAEPVLDVDRYTLTYSSPGALMRDLKRTGSTNATVGRPRGLTGRRRIDRVCTRYPANSADGRVPATCEVVFAHAWAPPQPKQSTGPDGVTEVPVSSITRRHRGQNRDA